jgi:hypothetical protein
MATSVRRVTQGQTTGQRTKKGTPVMHQVRSKKPTNEDVKAFNRGATIVAWIFMPEAMVVITLFRFYQKRVLRVHKNEKG